MEPWWRPDPLGERAIFKELIVKYRECPVSAKVIRLVAAAMRPFAASTAAAGCFQNHTFTLYIRSEPQNTHAIFHE